MSLCLFLCISLTLSYFILIASFSIICVVAGLSLKSQDLTAIFLAVRLYCSFVMEYDIHTLLDMATLASTIWVIYMIRFNLKSSYMADKDNFALYYVVSETMHWTFHLGYSPLYLYSFQPLPELVERLKIGNHIYN